MNANILPECPGVYLLHFCTPFGHARHYLGGAGRSVRARVAMQLSGTGANFTRIVLSAGIDLVVARVWTAEGHHEAFLLESKLKKQGGRSRMCPMCGAHVRLEEARP